MSGCECGAPGAPDAGGLDASSVDASAADGGASDAGGDAALDAGGDAAIDGGPACETLDVDAIMEAIHEARCEHGRACATYYQPQRASGCHRTTHDAWHADELAGLAEGRLRFDMANACECLARIRERRCTPPSEVPIACLHMFVGTRDGDCVTDAHCGRVGTCFRTDDVCPGECFVSGRPGEPCVTFEQCATGLACSDGVLRGRPRLLDGLAHVRRAL